MSSLREDPPGAPADYPPYAAHYRRCGFAIVRGLFTTEEIETIAAAIDRLHAEGVAHGRSFRHGNLFYKVVPAAGDVGPRVQMVQWPAYHVPALDAVRLERRIARLLEPLIGGDLKQIINQVHWKSAGAGADGDFAWHQDCRFREPACAYRNLGGAYVQTGLAIDPHDPESGGMRFIPASHLDGDLGLDCAGEVRGAAMDDAVLRRAGLDPAGAVELVLRPGDLALWSPYLVHGSGPNRAGHARRLYINGYVRAADCDRGEWAFQGGEPVPLGAAQALVHYEQLRERGEPHYP